MSSIWGFRSLAMTFVFLVALLGVGTVTAHAKHYYVYNGVMEQEVGKWWIKGLSIGYETGVSALQLYGGFKLGVLAGVTAIAYNVVTTPLSVPISSQAALFLFSDLVQKPHKKKLLESVGGGRLHIINSGPTKFLKVGKLPFFALKMDQRNLVLLERDEPLAKKNLKNWEEISRPSNATLHLDLWLGEERLAKTISLTAEELVEQKPMNRRRLFSWRERVRRYLNSQGRWRGRIAPHTEDLVITARMEVDGEEVISESFNNGPGVLEFLSLGPMQRMLIDGLKWKFSPKASAQIFDPEKPGLIKNYCQNLLAN